MILVVGSANLDFVIRTPRLPAAGETVLGKDFRMFPGGKGANQAVACARAGNAPTAMLLALGDDAFAAPIEASLRAAGVTLEIVRVAGQPTGTAFIFVSDGAENVITVCPGANQFLQAADLPALNRFTHVLLQLEVPTGTVVDVARAAKSRGLQVVLNAAPAQPLTPELLRLLDVLIVNETELDAIAGTGGDIRTRLAQIDVPCVIATLGARGCEARHGTEFLAQPGFAITPVDTTAAGDTFCGVLTAALAENRPLPDALRVATAAGALTCTRHGAQTSIPTHAELQAFLASR